MSENVADEAVTDSKKVPLTEICEAIVSGTSEHPLLAIQGISRRLHHDQPGLDDCLGAAYVLSSVLLDRKALDEMGDTYIRIIKNLLRHATSGIKSDNGWARLGNDLRWMTIENRIGQVVNLFAERPIEGMSTQTLSETNALLSRLERKVAKAKLTTQGADPITSGVELARHCRNVMALCEHEAPNLHRIGSELRSISAFMTKRPEEITACAISGLLCALNTDFMRSTHHASETKREILRIVFGMIKTADHSITEDFLGSVEDGQSVRIRALSQRSDIKADCILLEIVRDMGAAWRALKKDARNHIQALGGLRTLGSVPGGPTQYRSSSSVYARGSPTRSEADVRRIIREAGHFRPI